MVQAPPLPIAPEDRLSTLNVATLLGEMNNESKCITLLATPLDSFVQVSQVVEELRARNAYAEVGSHMFDIDLILTRMPDFLVQQTRDQNPLPGTSQLWVMRPSQPVNELATGLAGELLGFSLAHNQPLRTLIGEKRVLKHRPEANAIGIRLGVLAAILALHREDGSFGPASIKKVLNDMTDGIAKSTVHDHVKKLREAQIIALARGSKHNAPRYKVAERPDGKSVEEMLEHFIEIVAQAALGSTVQTRRGLKRGKEILDDEVALPLLVVRSFASSPRTGPRG